MKAIYLAFALLLVGCEPGPVPRPPPVPPPPPDNGECRPACARIEALKCKDLMQTPNGAPCVDWCAAYREHLNLTCIERATTCEAIDHCGK